ncbi:MAG: recombinase family protein [Planctomycetes bacterium]|nr:recombinase family protein [Planctomycetota bacterium]
MMRAALYARVSTEEQTEGYSLDAQKRAFQRLCEERGWVPHYEYIEGGKSAHTDDIRKRPVFKQAIDDALAGQYEVLVVHKIDRFSRKLRITLEYFEKLGKAGIGFISIQNNIDFSTPTGKFMLVMQGGLAELYSDNLSEETKKGWNERRKQGLYCGALPFGAMKGEDGVPVPDVQEREAGTNGNTQIVRNYEGLKLTFDLAVQGKSTREIAMRLNSEGYRTTGTHGSRLFSKDTVIGMLSNKFYIGYIPDGNGGWLRAKHEPFIDSVLFDEVQTMREDSKRTKSTINVTKNTYSLSTLMWCNRCNSKLRVQMNPSGRPRVYCAGRAKGDTDCDSRGTFLDIYEAQIEWYLEHFHIPEDYKEQILEAHSQLRSAYGDIEAQKTALENRLARTKELYEWGDINKEQYISRKSSIQREMRTLTVPEDHSETLAKLADFLSNVAQAWKAATQEQRNKLAKMLFQEIRIENKKVVAVRPRPELEPFFKLDFGCHAKTIAGDPDGAWACDFITSLNCSQFSLKNGSNSGRGFTKTTSWSFTQISSNRVLANLFLCSLVAVSHAFVMLPRNSANLSRCSVGTSNGVSLANSLSICCFSR